MARHSYATIMTAKTGLLSSNMAFFRLSGETRK